MKLPKIIIVGESFKLSPLVSEAVLRHYQVLYVRPMHLDTGTDRVQAILLIDSVSLDTVTTLSQLRVCFPNLPIIILSQQLDFSTVIETVRLGANDYLPFHSSPDEILYRIATNIHNHESASSSISFYLTPKNILEVVVQLWQKIHHFWYYLFYLQKLQLNKDVSSKPAIINSEIASSSFSSTSRMQISLLGKMEIRHQGKAVSFDLGRKARILLAFLLLNAQKPIHKDVIGNQFWQHCSTNAARNSLNVSIYSIRKCFKKILPDEAFILYSMEKYALNPELSLTTDVDNFYKHWKMGKELEQRNEFLKSIPFYEKAIALYRGDFMEDMVYEEWIESQRDHIKEAYLYMLDRLSLWAFEQKDYDTAIKYGEQALLKDNCLENIHQRLMICFFQKGNRIKAIQQFQKCKKTLYEELEVKPSKKTVELYEQITKGTNIEIQTQ